MSSDTKISSQEVHHIAKLARLNITPEEEKHLSDQLSETANYIDVLKELNTKDVIATAQVNHQKNVTRLDQVKDSLSQEEALSQAPDTYKGYFKTQATISKK